MPSELFPAFQKVPYSELKRACYNGASTKGRGRVSYSAFAYVDLSIFTLPTLTIFGSPPRASLLAEHIQWPDRCILFFCPFSDIPSPATCLFISSLYIKEWEFTSSKLN